MPWIAEEKCVGCGICVEECPADAITVTDNVARIDMDGCIKCGICHEVCPRDAVRHDKERIGREVQTNVEQVKKNISYFGDEEKRQGCLQRNMNYYNFMKTIAEKTLGELEQFRSGN